MEPHAARKTATARRAHANIPWQAANTTYAVWTDKGVILIQQSIKTDG
jgi:hypothetical protein